MSATLHNRVARSPFGRLAAALCFGSYAMLGRLAPPLVRRYLRKRVDRGREDPQRLAERFGTASQARPAGPLLWIHAASVGEAQSTLPLIGRLQRDWPGFVILMTSGTVTSAAGSTSEKFCGGRATPSTVQCTVKSWTPIPQLMMVSGTVVASPTQASTPSTSGSP